MWKRERRTDRPKETKIESETGCAYRNKDRNKVKDKERDWYRERILIKLGFSTILPINKAKKHESNIYP